jgi:tetrahydromethanopterin S-methyltransferase subunit G
VKKTARVAHEKVLRSIILVRGQKVILDRDLAELYGVVTKVFIQAVKRNVERFPRDFMFRLTVKEFARLRSQIVTSNVRGGRRSAPYAFTEQGVAMLSSVLRSRRAVAVNIEIMRAFVRLRRMISEHRELAKRIDELEERYDDKFEVVFDAIRSLINPATQPRKRIGYLSAGSFTPAAS